MGTVVPGNTRSQLLPRSRHRRRRGTQGPGCFIFWLIKRSLIKYQSRDLQIWNPACRVESKPKPLNLAFKTLCGLATSYLPTLTAHDAPT